MRTISKINKINYAGNLKVNGFNSSLKTIPAVSNKELHVQHMVQGGRYHPNLTLNIQPACVKQIIVVTYRHIRRQRAGEKEQRSCFSDKQITNEVIAPCFHKIYKATYGFGHLGKYFGDTMHLSKQRMHIYPCVFEGKGELGAPRTFLSSKSKRTMKPTPTSALTEASRLPQEIRQ